MKTGTTVKKAECIGDYKIAFEFSDGHKSVLDLFSFMSAKGQNPMTSKYLDVKKFRKFEIVDGTDISWNDNEMCYSLATIYKGGELKPMSMRQTINAVKKVLPSKRLPSVIRKIKKRYA